MTPKRIQQLKRRLQEARYRLMLAEPELARPLYDMSFWAVPDLYRMSVDRGNLYFDAAWLTKLPDVSLDFMLAHELLHRAMGHIKRPAYYRGDRFHLAADIAVNGRLALLGWQYEKLPGVGTIRYQTFLPRRDGMDLTALEAMKAVPFDPARMPAAKRRQYMIDSDAFWEEGRIASGEKTLILSPADPEPEDLPARSSRTGGNFHFIRDSITDEFYQCLKPEALFGDAYGKGEELPQPGYDPRKKDSWALRSFQTIRELRETRDMKLSDNAGDWSERSWQRSRRAGLDWRRLLDTFIQEELYDYSFLPPDRRFQDGGLMLPEMNVRSERPGEVVFMVDTSASVTQEMLSAVCGELSGALEQFGGQLKGTLCFFDTRVYRPVPLPLITDLSARIPVGGGGTDYGCIFASLAGKDRTQLPSSLVICTDGEAAWPPEEDAQGVPVLWLLTRDDVTAPWGRSTVIRV